MKTPKKTNKSLPLKGKLVKSMPAPPPDSDADIKAMGKEGYSDTGKNIKLSTLRNK